MAGRRFRIGTGKFLTRVARYIAAALVLFTVFAGAPVISGCSVFREAFTKYLEERSGKNKGEEKVTKEVESIWGPPQTQQVFADLCHWDGDIDFDAMKRDGVRGVVLRLARYNLEIDEKFTEYYALAKAEGLPVGCYFFSGAHSLEEAAADAERVLTMIEEMNLEFELPVFYDVENDGDRLISDNSRQMLTDIIKTFCEALEEGGICPGYYSNTDFADNYYYPEQLTKYCYWVASWSKKKVLTPDHYPNVCLWQYTSTASVSGVEEECDMNVTLRDILAYTADWYAKRNAPDPFGR
ncbi:MAG: hypothetical protein J6U38_03015 [Clostridia bacterium]|nr:hypothetical protein [Clostridia bacterium]